MSWRPSRRLAPFLVSAVSAAVALRAGAQTQFEEPAPPSEEAPAQDDSPAPPESAPAPPSEPDYADADPSALSDFRPALDGYGQWLEDPTYGQVWVPYSTVVGQDFVPYATSGHWALATDGGWIWVSDFPWGSIVFHYGRWVQLGDGRWAWIPGRQYAHAWVDWRVGAANWDYIGWAPAPPTSVWFAGAPVVFHFHPRPFFVFSPTRFVFAPQLHRHLVPHGSVPIVLPHTQPFLAPVNRVRVGPPPAVARVPTEVLPRVRVAAPPNTVLVPRTVVPSPAPPAGTVRQLSPSPGAAPQRVMPNRVAPTPFYSMPRVPPPAALPRALPPPPPQRPVLRAPPPQARPMPPPMQAPPPSVRVAPQQHAVPPSVRVAPPPHMAPPARAPAAPMRPAAPRGH